MAGDAVPKRGMDPDEDGGSGGWSACTGDADLVANRVGGIVCGAAESDGTGDDGDLFKDSESDLCVFVVGGGGLDAVH